MFTPGHGDMVVLPVLPQIAGTRVWRASSNHHTGESPHLWATTRHIPGSRRVRRPRGTRGRGLGLDGTDEPDQPTDGGPSVESDDSENDDSEEPDTSGDEAGRGEDDGEGGFGLESMSMVSVIEAMDVGREEGSR